LRRAICVDSRIVAIDHDAPGVRAGNKRVRDYRNALLHGRARLDAYVGDQLYSVKLARVANAADWRIAKAEDFAPAAAIVDEMWERVIAYLRRMWEAKLVRWAAQFGPPPSPMHVLRPQQFVAASATRAVSAESQPGSISLPGTP
jgi:hypothetical protein